MSSLTVGTLNVTDRLILPRLTTSQINALTPEEGLIVYDTDSNYFKIYVNGNWVESNVGQGNQLYEFTSNTFISAQARGTREGPGFNAFQSAYSSQTFANDSALFQSGSFTGVQRWTVPATGTYEIEGGGARGGRHSGGNPYNSHDIWGAKITGQFDLTQGEQLEILCGSGGNAYNDPHGNEQGGGGASWVKNYTNDQLLLVAGGGGGCAGNRYGNSCSKNLNDSYGQTTNGVNPTTCQGTYTTSTPQNGYGGYPAGPYSGQGGGGWFGGSPSQPSPWHCSSGPNPTAQQLSQGAEGSTGSSCYTSQGQGNRGGFGSGGGGNLGGPGGAGGYTGGCASGGWSSYSQHGGGGGSFNIGANQTNIRGGHNLQPSGGTYSGEGYIKITFA